MVYQFSGCYNGPDQPENTLMIERNRAYTVIRYSIRTFGVKNTLLSAFFLIYLSCPVYGAGGSDEWLSQRNPSARIKALGGAGIALKDSPSPLYMNPGSMAYDPYGRLSVFYGNLYDGTHFGYMEFVNPFRFFGSLGLGAQMRYKDNSNFIQDYTFGFAVKLFEGFYWGNTVRAVMKRLDDDYASGYGVDSGIHLTLLKWVNAGIRAENILAPELEYEVLGIIENFDRNAVVGFNFFYEEYINLVIDIDLIGIAGDNPVYKGGVGLEICPDPAFSFRLGSKDRHLRLGLGTKSKNMEFDYAVNTEFKELVHFLQCTYKFGLTISRKEKELLEKDKNLGKEILYLEGLIYLNMGEVAAAQGKANEYTYKFGTDDRIKNLEYNISKWLDRTRKEKIGRAEDFKREILKKYYQGKIEQALIHLENLKLIAPGYEEIPYLENLLNARIFLEDGKYLEAEDALIEALKINPDSNEVKELHNRLKEVIKLSE